MNFKITHEGYGDPKLYEPIKRLYDKLNLKCLSHKEHVGSYPKYSCWTDFFYVPDKNVFLEIIVYPESAHPDGYGKGRTIAEYLINVTFENKEDSQKAEEVNGLVRKIMEDVDAKDNQSD